MVGFMLKQNRMKSLLHAARFSASDGAAANPAVAEKVDATTATIPSNPRILYMVVSFLFADPPAWLGRALVESAPEKGCDRCHFSADCE
jgi:hypothetical protein